MSSTLPPFPQPRTHYLDMLDSDGGGDERDRPTNQSITLDPIQPPQDGNFGG